MLCAFCRNRRWHDVAEGFVVRCCRHNGGGGRFRGEAAASRRPRPFGGPQLGRWFCDANILLWGGLAEISTKRYRESHWRTRQTGNGLARLMWFNVGEARCWSWDGSDGWFDLQ